MEDFEEDRPYQSAMSEYKMWEIMEQYTDDLKLLLGMNYYLKIWTEFWSIKMLFI